MPELQKRIFYACQGVFFLSRNDNTGDEDISTATFLTGVQSIGVDYDSSFTSLADTGRFQRKTKFDNKQKQFTINIERVLNKGDNTLYYSSGYISGQYEIAHILHEDNIGCQGQLNNNDKSLRNYDIVIVYGPDDAARLDTNNTLNCVVYRNCLITSLGYAFSVDGSVTERISLTSARANYNPTGYDSLTIPVESAPQSGDVLRRQDIDMSNTIIPDEAEAIFKDALNETLNDKLIYGIQSIDIEVTIDYTNLNDIGIWRGADTEGDDNLWKFVVLPINVTSSITGTTRTAYPLNDIEYVDEKYKNDKQIKIVTFGDGANFYVWDLGTKNYLTNIGVSGGDTGGGNVELTLSYQNDYSDIVIARTLSIQNFTNNGPY